MASRGVNRAIVLGNLGADPELRYTQAGTPVANLSVATSETWKDKTTGAAQERTEWHRIVAFARLAEIMGQYLRKGSKVYIEGRIQTRKWQGQDGADRYTTEIVAHEMQMLGDGPKPASAAPPAANAERGFGRAHAGHVPGTPDPAAAYRNASQGRSVGQRGPRSAPPASPGDDIPF